MFAREIEATHEYLVQWEPGVGLLGLLQSTIKGSGPVEVTKIASRHPSGPDTITNVHSARDSEASIELFAWDHYIGPTLTGEPIPPVPTKLKLVVDYGEVAYTRTGPASGGDLPIDDYDGFGVTYRVTFLEQQGRDWTLDEFVFIVENHRGQATLEKDWQLSAQPFKAALAFGGTYFEPTPIDIRVEVIVEHDPL